MELVFEMNPNYKDVQAKLTEIYAKIAESQPISALTPYATTPTFEYKPAMVEDFSYGLTNWTSGPHLDDYAVIDGTLYTDGRGHLTGPGGWGYSPI